MSCTTNTEYEEFEDLEDLVRWARKFLFYRAFNNVPFDEEFLPLTWLIEAHSVGKYESLFKVWTSGLKSMHGKTLIERCMEIELNDDLGPTEE